MRGINLVSEDGIRTLTSVVQSQITSNRDWSAAGYNQPVIDHYSSDVLLQGESGQCCSSSQYARVAVMAVMTSLHSQCKLSKKALCFHRFIDLLQADFCAARSEAQDLIVTALGLSAGCWLSLMASGSNLNICWDLQQQLIPCTISNCTWMKSYSSSLFPF